ncbi:hypothetical protein BUALT_Bualt09G0101200 [Buddleja alternifolia]|uniref:Uncharacterized protein n=1 Tax=Buddleja alternifolia TaxID=168488 RepID=A0AAV6X0T3_9LAMI|nr:hypothetical protein BUALT_Bualt09G0101200 [Buddleja alternifolia]
MDYVVSAPPPPQSQDHPILLRRNSISASFVVAPPTMLTLLHHHNSAVGSSDDLELLSIKPSSRSYISLKDLLPSVTINSPKPNPAQPGSDICIRNRLVKHAARAYLQPMSTSFGSAGGNFFHRLWTRVAAVIGFVRRNVIRAIDDTLRVIRIRGSR